MTTPDLPSDKKTKSLLEAWIKANEQVLDSSVGFLDLVKNTGDILQTLDMDTDQGLSVAVTVARSAGYRHPAHGRSGYGCEDYTANDIARNFRAQSYLLNRVGLDPDTFESYFMKKLARVLEAAKENGVSRTEEFENRVRDKIQEIRKSGYDGGPIMN